MSSHQYQASKISCGRCGIDHPYFACNSAISPSQPTNITDALLSELIIENQKLHQELIEIKAMLWDVVVELRKTSNKKVLQD